MAEGELIDDVVSIAIGPVRADSSAWAWLIESEVAGVTLAMKIVVLEEDNISCKA